ncbi:MAG TPA: PAC2 family protein [Desulfosarcina sp.]|nr:PAC2 family protein [Desulfosarcina sp.]
MHYTTLQMEPVLPLTAPVMIIGFRGWGNALEVASGMAAYLVDMRHGRAAGRLDPDLCYRYDENRPVVQIDSGRMISINPPGGSFFAVETGAQENDLLVLVADEPSINWYRFSQELVDLAVEVAAPAVISLGSMFDSVLHTDRIVSSLATGADFDGVFDRHGVIPINYHGPSAIHTLILDACRKRGMTGASLWSHCPAYLQGITHHGMMLQLAGLLADMAAFSLKTDALEARWEALELQIRQLITESPKLEAVIEQIRRKKREGAWQNLDKHGNEQDNVIDLRDFIDP